jgi:hypothetical protein
LRTDVITRLAQKAVELGQGAPAVILKFAQFEIDRVADLLGTLAGHEQTREGEDNESRLTLTRMVTRQIDAVSLFTLDAVGQPCGGFWDLGVAERYLDLQQQAVLRGVKVRRMFVVERDDLVRNEAFLRICRRQNECGIELRVLIVSTVPVGMRHMLQDYVLFDEAISFELTSGLPASDGTSPLILSTRFVCEPRMVAARKHDYAQLWQRATQIPDVRPLTESTP